MSERKSEVHSHWQEMAVQWKAWWDMIRVASAPVSQHMVDWAEVPSGGKVLDLATGMGEPALSFARQLGSKGQVIGIDQSEDMVSFARGEAQAAGLNNTHFEVQDAEALNIGVRDFDALVSRWGLMFFTQLPESLAHLRTYLKPGGYFIASVWGNAEEAPMISLIGEVFEACFHKPLPRKGPSPLSLSDRDALHAVFQSAGYGEIQIEPLTVTFVYDSPDQYLAQRKAFSKALVDELEMCSQAQRNQFYQAVNNALKPFQTEQQIHIPNTTLCLRARNPVL